MPSIGRHERNATTTIFKTPCKSLKKKKSKEDRKEGKRKKREGKKPHGGKSTDLFKLFYICLPSGNATCLHLCSVKKHNKIIPQS